MGILRFIKNHIRHDRDTKARLETLNMRVQEIADQINDLLLHNRMDGMREKTLNCVVKGVSQERYCSHEIVVSLTSFGNRIYDVHLAIESIMQGTLKPNRIVLWLSEEEFKGKPLPRMLEMQKARGLQVEYCEDIKSYTKLIPSLRNYPEACIITIDDDVIYEYDMVERLVLAHCEKPKAICACRMHKVKLDGDKKPLSYMDWDWCVKEYGINSNLFFPTGVGGILYPPGCFSPQVMEQEVFMDICRYADDVWFYAMRLMNDTPITQVYVREADGFMELPSRFVEALSKDNTNASNCRNDVQMKAVFEKYNLYEKLV